jgi:hypothetical protein
VLAASLAFFSAAAACFARIFSASDSAVFKLDLPSAPALAARAAARARSVSRWFPPVGESRGWRESRLG